MNISYKQFLTEFPRWENKVRVNPHTSCWEWLGRLDPEGYPMGSNKKAPNTGRAHRVSYRVLVDNIPRELTIDHECEVRHCVNPNHMFPCSAVDNIKRGAERRRLRLWQGPLATVVQLRRAKGICPSGHILAEVGVLERRPNSGDLRCKACQHETQRKHREKNGIKTGKPRGAYGSRNPNRPKSNYKGVSWRAKDSKWIVMVYHQGKNNYGGAFTDEHEAGRVSTELRNRLEDTPQPE